MKPILLVSVLALGTMTTAALAESITPINSQSGAVKLTVTQMDRVTAGVNQEQIKRKTTPPTFTFGEFKSGRCQNLGQCKKE